MTWPAQPETLGDLPRLDYIESPWYDDAPYLSEEAVTALCRFVGAHTNFLDLITDGDEDHEAVVGSTLITGVLSGVRLSEVDPDELTERVLRGHELLLMEVSARDELSVARLAYITRAAVMIGKSVYADSQRERVGV